MIGEQLLDLIKQTLKEGKPFLVGIDGDAAAGKSTLAVSLGKLYGCPVLHMDYFFLPPPLRTPERLAEPGGNVDYTRFNKEVLTPLLAGEPFKYRPFDCKTMDFAEEIAIKPGRLAIVEGAYTFHPTLAHAYDIKVFVAVDQEEQMRRIINRNGAEAAQKFKDMWIPMEKQYHAAFDIQAGCQIHIKT
ncbi:MAG: uridine kinase [Defluviitaleaceae bacterium]|nr:uridine kinase [Defluviitaleaceae bacterium]